MIDGIGLLSHSAVKAYCLSADPFGVIAGEEGYYFGNILRFSQAVKGIQ
jgi:hypothetical protein